jgi:hypothetical protein
MSTQKTKKQVPIEHYTSLQKELEALKAKMEARIVREEKRAAFDALLRASHQKSMREFAKEVIDAVSESFKVFRAVFYVFNRKTEMLRAVATYGCSRKKLIKKRFALGEGVIGEAAQDFEVKQFANIVDNSGSGNTVSLNKATMLVYPLHFNKQCFGAWELVFAQGVTEETVQTIHGLAQNTALIMEGVTAAERLERELKVVKSTEKELRDILEINEMELVMRIENLAQENEALHEEIAKLNTELSALKKKDKEG